MHARLTNLRYILWVLTFYILVNIFVSFFQKKALVVGERGRVILERVGNSLVEKYVWVSSLTMLELDGTVNAYPFQRTFICISPTEMINSPRNISILKRISRYTKIYFMVVTEDDVDIIKRLINELGIKQYKII